MKISALDFSNSFFNIGSGFDIQPLLRFTHLCENFIYTNLFIDQEKIEKWYDFALQYHRDLEIINKKVISDFDEVEYFELHEDYLFHITQPKFITLDALRGYQETFNMALGRQQFAIEYTILRKSLNREIKLFILTSEGLASYLLLSQNGKYAPKVLCTIETGALEHPDGIMNDFFKEESNSKPMAWIRGFEPRYKPFRLKNNTLDTIGEFPVRILDFNHRWTCGWSYQPKQRTMIRYCKAFASKDGLNKINSMTLKEEILTSKNQFITGSIFDSTHNIKNTDLIIIPKSFQSKISSESFALFWENIDGFWHYSSVKEQLESLFHSLRDKNIKDDSILHLIPFCREDEGELYHRILRESKLRVVIKIIVPKKD